MQLDEIDFSNGMWRGLLTAEKSGASPTFSVELNGAVVEGTRISAGPSDREWVIDIPIPNHAIGDGVYTFLIFVEGNSAPVGSFCISAGRAMEYDLQAEVALLREKLEILIRAFRRHIQNAATCRRVTGDKIHMNWTYCASTLSLGASKCPNHTPIFLRH